MILRFMNELINHYILLFVFRYFVIMCKYYFLYIKCYFYMVILCKVIIYNALLLLLLCIIIYYIIIIIIMYYYVLLLCIIIMYYVLNIIMYYYVLSLLCIIMYYYYYVLLLLLCIIIITMYYYYYVLSLLCTMHYHYYDIGWEWPVHDSNKRSNQATKYHPTDYYSLFYLQHCPFCHHTKHPFSHRKSGVYYRSFNHCYVVFRGASTQGSCRGQFRTCYQSTRAYDQSILNVFISSHLLHYLLIQCSIIPHRTA